MRRTRLNTLLEAFHPVRRRKAEFAVFESKAGALETQRCARSMCALDSGPNGQMSSQPLLILEFVFGEPKLMRAVCMLSHHPDDR